MILVGVGPHDLLDEFYTLDPLSRALHDQLRAVLHFVARIGARVLDDGGNLIPRHGHREELLRVGRVFNRVRHVVQCVIHVLIVQVVTHFLFYSLDSVAEPGM